MFANIKIVSSIKLSEYFYLTQIGTTFLIQSGPVSNDNERVLHIPQSFRNVGSYQGNLLRQALTSLQWGCQHIIQPQLTEYDVLAFLFNVHNKYAYSDLCNFQFWLSVKPWAGMEYNIPWFEYNWNIIHFLIQFLPFLGTKAFCVFLQTKFPARDKLNACSVNLKTWWYILSSTFRQDVKANT